MKFRTDFVTNSSDTSYISFNVKNQKLYDLNESLGIKINSKGDGVLDDSMEIVLPSGMVGRDDGEAQLRTSASKDSISKWIMLCIQNFELDDVDGLIEERENPDEDFDWDEECDEYLEAFRDELSELLTRNVINQAASMDDAIEYGTIRHEEGFEGTIYICEEIEIQNGIRTIETPERSLVYSQDLDELDFSGKPGEIITQVFSNGHWITDKSLKPVKAKNNVSEEEMDTYTRLKEAIKTLGADEAEELVIEMFSNCEIDLDEYQKLINRIQR